MLRKSQCPLETYAQEVSVSTGAVCGPIMNFMET